MNNEHEPKQSGSNPSDKVGDKEDEVRLPEVVVDRLKNIDHHAGSVPDAVRASIRQDAADVLRKSRTQPVRRQSGLSRRAWAGISGGILASALMVFVMINHQPPLQDTMTITSNQQASQQPTSQNAFSATQIVRSGQDIDGDGQLDILDAFALAKSLEAKDTTDPFQLARMDQNGDGIVDEEDVSRLAMSVVML